MIDLQVTQEKLFGSNITLNKENGFLSMTDLLKAGNKEEAKTQFETIREKYSTSLAGREIGQYLALVN